MRITPKIAIDTLKEAFKKDPDYAWSWHCNIAVCSMDEDMEHDAANRAAAKFMKLAFSIDTEKHKCFAGTQIKE